MKTRTLARAGWLGFSLLTVVLGWIDPDNHKAYICLLLGALGGMLFAQYIQSRAQEEMSNEIEEQRERWRKRSINGDN